MKPVLIKVSILVLGIVIGKYLGPQLESSNKQSVSISDSNVVQNDIQSESVIKEVKTSPDGSRVERIEYRVERDNTRQEASRSAQATSEVSTYRSLPEWRISGAYAPLKAIPDYIFGVEKRIISSLYLGIVYHTNADLYVSVSLGF